MRGRAQKYFKRKRFIYALVFPDSQIYIGQSVHPEKRFRQHQLDPKWGFYRDHMSLVVLHTFEGTQADGESLELRYRLKAKRHGYRVFGLPGIVIQPGRRALLWDHVKSFSLPWPRGLGFARWPWLVAGVVLGTVPWLV